ncbi:hypothetical protein [Absidia glauca]|uniref:Uncharacterized protein n=1 Tax=Absidia glauca TaxID=4829 RepID=A0A163JA91_ABSGL|nr:hypothetical protein [Absidia glauca]
MGNGIALAADYALKKKEEEYHSAEDSSVTDTDTPTVSQSSHSSMVSLPTLVDPSTSSRSYDGAVLFACQESSSSEHRQTQILHLIDSLGLQLVSLVNEHEHGHENIFVPNFVLPI